MSEINDTVVGKRFTFADIEDSMTLGGFKLKDILAVGVSLLIGVGLLNQIGGFLGLISCLGVFSAGISLVTVSIRGKKINSWILLLMQWTLNTKLNQVPDLTMTHFGGTLTESESFNFKEDREHIDFETFNVKFLKKIRIVSTSDNLGLIMDPLNKKVIILLKAAKGQFGLQTAGDKDATVSNWARTVYSIKESLSSISTIQIITVTHRTTLEKFKLKFNDSITDLNSDVRILAAKSYNDFLDSTDSTHLNQSTYIAIAVSNKAVNLANSVVNEDISTTAFTAAKNAVRILRNNGFTVSGICTKKAIENVFKSLMFDIGNNPIHRDRKDLYRFAHKSEWDHLKINSNFISAYWISAWPKFEVLSDFMSPLILNCIFPKVFSLIVSPVDFETARREAESKLISHIADDELRSKAGFLNSATRAHSKSKSELLNYEIARGYETFKYSGYLSVASNTLTGLKNMEAQLELAAVKCGLSLQKLYGKQDEAVSFILPLCRGLK